MIINYLSTPYDPENPNGVSRCHTRCPGIFKSNKPELTDEFSSAGIMVGSAVCRMYCLCNKGIDEKLKQVICEGEEKKIC